MMWLGQRMSSYLYYVIIVLLKPLNGSFCHGAARDGSTRSAPCDTPSWSRIKVSGVRNSSAVFLAVILKILLIKFESTPCRIRD
jgi:hypothetical protein